MFNPSLIKKDKEALCTIVLLGIIYFTVTIKIYLRKDGILL